MKTYKTIIIAITLILGVQTIASAQSWHEKYWFYRYRFRQYFTDIGEGTGKSLVSDVRNANSKDDEYKQTIGVGDQTIDLAWYLGILALEAEQLSWQNDMTLTELYYAIKAFERLDMCEDKYPWNKSTFELDGFFMRFDAELIDENYQHDMTNFNQGLEESDVFLTQPPGMPTYVDRFQKMVDTDWDNNLDLEFESKHAAMSQDQAAAMLMGLALVKRFAPSGPLEFHNTIENNTTTFNFREHAEDNALNITTYLKNSIADVYIPDIGENLDIDHPFIEEILQYSNLSDDFDFGNWIIIDPNDDLVHRGKDARFARRGYLKACQQITNESISFPNDGYAEWEAIAHFTDFSLAPPGPYYNRIIWANLAVVGDSWEITTANPFGPDFEIRTTPGAIHRLLQKSSLKRYEVVWNGPMCFIFSYEDYPPTNTDHEKLYNLIWVALHCNDDEDMYHNINDYEFRISNILDSAPLCGPYSFAKDDSEAADIEFDFDGCNGCMLPNRAAPGWRSSNRFRNEPYEFNGFKYHNTGNYPGHDYMMLFNLYRYYRIWWYGSGDDIGSYRNMIESFESQAYPYYENNTYYGTVGNPANLRSFETFHYSGEIDELNNQKGCLNIRAGNKIVLEPGCHIKSGSRFNAKIEKYDCWEVGNGKISSTFYDNNYIQNRNNISGMKYSGTENDSHNLYKSPVVNISIYPNPSHDFIKIEGSPINFEFSIRITDINGKLIITKSINSSETIDISYLENGVYIAEIYSKGYSKKNKFIKL